MEAWKSAWRQDFEAYLRAKSLRPATLGALPGAVPHRAPAAKPAPRPKATQPARAASVAVPRPVEVKAALRLCSVEGCREKLRPVNRSGLCGHHYNRARYARKQGSARPVCGFTDGSMRCAEPLNRAGLRAKACAVCQWHDPRRANTTAKRYGRSPRMVEIAGGAA